MKQDQKLVELLVEIEIIANYLKQQVANGTISGALYKQQIDKFVNSYDAYKVSKNKRD